MNAAAMRWRVSETRRIEYELCNVADVFDPASDVLLADGRIAGGRRFVVVDEVVLAHHGARLAAYFAHHGIDARIVALPGGERGKTMEAWQGLLRTLDEFPIHRRDEPILAIGGGVLTDVVGFVASSYRRGVPGSTSTAARTASAASSRRGAYCSIAACCVPCRRGICATACARSSSSR